jgi:hypothetical protein
MVSYSSNELIDSIWRRLKGTESCRKEGGKSLMERVDRALNI